MFDVDTVYVVATSRGTYPAIDIMRAARWGSNTSFYVVIVDRNNQVTKPDDITDGMTILTLDENNRSSDRFVAGLGVKWCCDNSVRAKQFILLDDKCLITQRGLDEWSLEHITKHGVGIIGARDRLNYEDAYDKVSPLMDQWGMPYSQWIPTQETLHDAALFMSAPLADTLYKKELLMPEDAAQWPLPYGPYISWAAQMLGYYQVGWGTMDQQMPPLYINAVNNSRCLPAPHVLSPQFKLFYSVMHVPAYSEHRLRETFKRMRGEEAQEFGQFGHWFILNRQRRRRLAFCHVTLNSLVDLSTMHRRLLRCLDSKSYFVASYFDYDDRDVVADHEGFVLFPAEN